MRILYFTSFYEPETMAASFRATENAKIWKKMGHRVNIFTGYPNYPLGKIYDGYTPKLMSREVLDGIGIIRSKLIVKPNTSLFNRLQNALSYYLFGLANIIINSKKIGKKYNVVLGTSGVIFNAMLANTFAKLHRIPFVFEIRDITYKQLQAAGKGEKSLAVRGMKWLELRLCRKAAKVVVVTHGYKKLLVKEGIPAKKIEVITNGVDIEKKSGSYEDSKPFVLSYFGTLGISQGIMNTFDYAGELNEMIEGFRYLIIGEGAQKDEIELKAKQIECIDVMPGMTSEELEPFYDNTKLSVISLRKTKDFKYTIPSKLFQIMGRGIAVLYIGPEGESAEIIRKNKAGLTLTGTKEEDMEKLRSFFSGDNWRDELKQMGENGQKAVEKHYSRTKLAKDYITILESARK